MTASSGAPGEASGPAPATSGPTPAASVEATDALEPSPAKASRAQASTAQASRAEPTTAELIRLLQEDRLWLLRQIDAGQWSELRLDLAALERELGQLLDRAAERFPAP